MKTAWEKSGEVESFRATDPIQDGTMYAFRNFELHWAICPALVDGNTLADTVLAGNFGHSRLQPRSLL
ncbi:hypothetical protein [Leisingera daeponensis]|uniref:hypothetical protein n=1 Tax=Leisingera daeponensis TaxID=405746 RepID=UPI001C983E06|nr:hypothetical protein [Leisingera daeponensis]MBY6059591.1 hypothetical protein [Leisingera daeponensis]